MSSAALRRALTESPLRPLPDQVTALLETLSAPPRLAAHLRAVHDVAWQLTEALGPRLKFDRAAVLFGAATHDIGKTVHLNELSGPGSAHEQTGYELLLAHGIDETLARFARTHASWHSPGIDTDDLLVSIADKIWKAKRVPDLEQLVVDRLATATGRPPWQAFLDLDDILAQLAADADNRLAFQAGHPIHQPRPTMADEWRSVVAINDHGLALGIGRDGSWQVAENGQVRGPARGRNLMMLLPLLERPFRQVAEQVPADCPAAPWDELVVFALDWPTEYWPGLALGWLESDCPLSGVRHAVAEAKDDQRRSQPFRDRASRLCGQPGG